jgi:nucleolin
VLGFHSLSYQFARFVRNIFVLSEFDQEEKVLSNGNKLRFSPDLKLFVGNLPFSVDNAQLAGLFESTRNLKMVEVLILGFDNFDEFEFR